jgi:hypothetical protein
MKAGKLLSRATCILVCLRWHPDRSRCLNCLSFSHRRVDCRLPTWSFNCHRLCHYLRDCKRPHKSPAALGDYEACVVATGRRVVWTSCDGSCACPASQTPRDTLLSLGDEGTSDAQALAPFVASGFPKSDLIFPIALVCFILLMGPHG